MACGEVKSKKQDTSEKVESCPFKFVYSVSVHLSRCQCRDTVCTFVTWLWVVQHTVAASPAVGIWSTCFHLQTWTFQSTLVQSKKKKPYKWKFDHIFEVKHHTRSLPTVDIHGHETVQWQRNSANGHCTASQLTGRANIRSEVLLDLTEDT